MSRQMLGPLDRTLRVRRGLYPRAHVQGDACDDLE
jgi:hypothetical protein